LSNAEKKQTSADVEVVKEAGLTTLAIIAAILSVSNPISAAGVAIGSIALSVILKMFPTVGTTGDIWDKLEEKISTKIGNKLAAAKVHDLKVEVLYPINRRLLKDREFTAEDLEEILDRMQQVMPGNMHVGWNYDLPLVMVYYLPYMIAGYQKIIGDGLLPKCSLANDMANYRAKVIVGMKEMMRKRYMSIITKKSVEDIGTSGWEGSWAKASLTYTDTVTNTDFTIGLHFSTKHFKTTFEKSGTTWETEIKKIRDTAVNFLFKEIIQKINKFFTPESCLSTFGCRCPEPIRKDEIDFGYPLACMGDDDCRHPSGKFSASHYFCYLKGDGLMDSRYQRWKTDKIDFETCMPVKGVYIPPLNNITSYVDIKQSNRYPN